VVVAELQSHVVEYIHLIAVLQVLYALLAGREKKILKQRGIWELVSKKLSQMIGECRSCEFEPPLHFNKHSRD